MNYIERDVYVLENRIKEKIDYVRGTNALPIYFHFRDYEIPEGATAKAFVLKPSKKATYNVCPIIENTVRVIVKDQTFAELGKSVLQIVLTMDEETLVTFDQPIEEEYMDRIVGLLSSNFNVITRNYMSEHKKALHNMSQGIVTDLYNKIPAYNEIRNIEQESSEFEKKALEKLSLKHLGEQEEGSIPKYVFDFQEELKKVMEKLCICDYFYDVQHETAVWDMGVEMIVSKIKFQDVEHVLTIMSSESSQIPIFCTKTFLSLKKSLEDAKVVDRLWIEKSRKKGKLSLAYNATKDEFLEVKILSGIRFKREDLKIAEEIYNQYANGTIGEIKNQNQRNIV